jgi:hypothetical protein
MKLPAWQINEKECENNPVMIRGWQPRSYNNKKRT